jgi:hypothetical protein
VEARFVQQRVASVIDYFEQWHISVHPQVVNETLRVRIFDQRKRLVDNLFNFDFSLASLLYLLQGKLSLRSVLLEGFAVDLDLANGGVDVVLALVEERVGK